MKNESITSAEKRHASVNKTVATETPKEAIAEENKAMPKEVLNEEFEGYYVVTGFTVGVRTEPGVKKNNPTIETLFRGAKVYSDGTNVVIDGNTWLKVKSNGKDGYILKLDVAKL